jgi:hypothetical protein
MKILRKIVAQPLLQKILAQPLLSKMKLFDYFCVNLFNIYDLYSNHRETNASALLLI